MTDDERAAIAHLSTITNPTERAAAGTKLFGKRYLRDIAPLCDPFPEAPLEKGAWLITWQGREWSENDLCGAHAALITIMSGKDEFANLDPFKGPMALMQLIAAFIAVADQTDPMEVLGELGRTPLKALLDAVSTV